MTLNHPDYFDFFDEHRKATFWEKVLIATFTGAFHVILIGILYWLIF